MNWGAMSRAERDDDRDRGHDDFGAGRQRIKGSAVRYYFAFWYLLAAAAIWFVGFETGGGRLRKSMTA